MRLVADTTREDWTRRPAGTIRRVRWLALASWGAPLPPTLADCYDAFLADAAHLARLRPRTVRAYRYELAAAAADPRFAAPLDALPRVLAGKEQPPGRAILQA